MFSVFFGALMIAAVLCRCSWVLFLRSAGLQRGLFRILARANVPFLRYATLVRFMPFLFVIPIGEKNRNAPSSSYFIRVVLFSLCSVYFICTAGRSKKAARSRP